MSQTCVESFHSLHCLRFLKAIITKQCRIFGIELGREHIWGLICFWFVSPLLKWRPLKLVKNRQKRCGRRYERLMKDIIKEFLNVNHLFLSGFDVDYWRLMRNCRSSINVWKKSCSNWPKSVRRRQLNCLIRFKIWRKDWSKPEFVFTNLRMRM